MNLLEAVKHILYADSFVSKNKAEVEQRNQRGIALIAMAAFIVMSILNIKQQSYTMLLTTGMSAAFLMVGFLVSKYKNHSRVLKIIFYFISVGVFTYYTLVGGNDGFAVLWLLIATYAVMIAIDFKAGFIISSFYLIMLLLLFRGPLSFLLQFDYNVTFRLRFPFLYASNFAFATYIAIRIRLYQYELLLKQQELEHLGTVDLSTGLRNRNYFIKYEGAIPADNLKMLSAVFIDVNGLHEINNRHGHDAGDMMLCRIAGLCRKHFRGHSIYRMGGDEFLILCRDAEEKDVLDATNGLVNEVEGEGYSISYGIDIQKRDFDVDEVVKNADAKMIKFKRDYYMCAKRNTR